MISRLNYTNRRKIPRRLVEIALTDEEPRRFDAHLDLDGFPPEAEVIIEATSSRSPVIQRFHFGTVGEIVPPEDRRLTEITGEHVHFAVKVVDRSARVGRLLGIAEHLRPHGPGQGEGERRSILPVDPTPLGHRLWRLHFDEANVYLQVNNQVDQIKDIVRGDERFVSLVYPEIVRQVLDRVVAVEGWTEIQGDDDDWRDLWLRFGVHLHPERQPPPSLPERIDASARADLDQWLDEVIDAFCWHHRLRDRFVETMASDG